MIGETIYAFLKFAGILQFDNKYTWVSYYAEAASVV